MGHTELSLLLSACDQSISGLEILCIAENLHSHHHQRNLDPKVRKALSEIGFTVLWGFDFQITADLQGVFFSQWWIFYFSSFKIIYMYFKISFLIMLLG